MTKLLFVNEGVGLYAAFNVSVCSLLAFVLAPAQPLKQRFDWFSVCRRSLFRFRADRPADARLEIPLEDHRGRLSDPLKAIDIELGDSIVEGGLLAGVVSFGVARRVKDSHRFGRARASACSCAALAVAAALSLTGCGELPASAPTAGEILNTPNNGANGIFVFDLDRSVIDALASTREDSFLGRFGSKAPPADLRIAVGDTLQIAVIEDSTANLIGRPGESANAGGSPSAQPLLPMTVARDGTINVPYVGEISAAGRTVESLRATIERKLSDKAVNPQVQVALANGPYMSANSATVGGEVAHSGIYALRPSGSRLLDLLAEAGTDRYPAYETTVHLNRGKRQGAVSLQRIVDRPDDNVFVYPRDLIYLSHDPKTFTVLGASTKVGRYPFGSEVLNLAEAVAEAGGFVDSVSDPAGVFVFRYEPIEFVKSLRSVQPTLPQAPTPVIYRLNLRDGDGFFLARQFAVRDKDIILLANADGTQLLKFLTLLQDVSGIAANLRTVTLSTTSNGTTTTTTTSSVGTH